MSFVLGVLLAAGLLLVASPVLWPGARMPRHSALAARWRERLAQAGLSRVGPGLLVAVSLVMGVAAASVVFALVPVAALAASAGVVTLALPAVLVTRRARAHRRAARVVWPDVVDQLVSTVRAGLALPDGVATLATTGPVLTRAPFERFHRSYRRSGDFGASLDELKSDLADPVADRIIEALRLAREVGGGELTTILRNLGTFLRDDAALRAEIEARQSWVLSAAKLGVAAPWVVLGLLASRPEAAVAYGSGAGSALIGCGLAVTLVAYRLMVRIGRLPEEPRWFA